MSLLPVGLYHWLWVTGLLFSIGIYGLLTRKNAVGVLISMEIMLNAVALNFVVFNKFLSPMAIDGALMSIFIIAVAAAEVVIGMAIFVSLYKQKRTLDVTEMDSLKN